MTLRFDGIMIAIYLSILLIFSSVHLLSFDTYYYWAWSRHLALSYYDGSPMIAYFIKLSTLLFGDTLVALNVAGIASTSLTGFVLYKTARLFLSKRASFITLSLWLFSPLVSLALLKQTTYDAPLVLFWSLTLFFAVQFIKANQIRSLYGAGISVGLMLLSKYSGIVLVVPLLLFLMQSSYRSVFKTYHFYCIMVLVLMIFSPVLIWNAQHGWQSFTYQLTTHHVQHVSNPVSNIVKMFFDTMLPGLNFMLIPLFPWERQSNEKEVKTKEILRLLRLISVVFVGFYASIASMATVKINWLTPYLLSSALLSGYYFQMNYGRKYIRLLTIAYVVIALGIFINSTFPVVMPKKFIYYHLVRNLDKSLPERPKTIITTGWLEARILFFLANKPEVYTLNCGIPQNQYALWSKHIAKQIQNKTLKEALYVDTQNRVACIEQYFDRCERMVIPGYVYQKTEYGLYVYQCVNHPGEVS